ncbi:MAG: proline dehydrogenase family protein, partial [Terriglobales bacterium]
AAAVAILDAIGRGQVQSTLSVKLTQLGLDLSLDLARLQLQHIVEHAAALGTFIRVDMEGSDYTAVTLDLVEQLHAAGAPVGTVLQAYLHRTAADLERLLALGVRVRLVKGAYREPPELAIQAKADVDANYERLMYRLLDDAQKLPGQGEGAERKAAVPCGYHAIATHDERMVERAIAHAREQHLPPDQFEFQMLYGIRRDLQQRLVGQGWRVRVYTPFGPEWYPYFMRRLAERPANVLFLLKNMVR